MDGRVVSDLAKAFVEGKAPQRFVELSAEMDKFLNLYQPILEEVYNAITDMENMKLGKIDPDKLIQDLEADLRNASEGLVDYNKIFDRVNTDIVIIMSNYDLRTFLKEALVGDSISGDELADLERAADVYWNDTYGYLTARWAVVWKKLRELRDVLQQEVDLLTMIPNATYRIAMKDNQDLRKLFMQERDKFYEIVHLFADTQDRFLSQTRSRFETALKQQRQALIAKRRTLNEQYQEKMAATKNEMVKGFIILSYLAGAYKIAIGILKGKPIVKSAKGLILLTLRHLTIRDKTERRADSVLGLREYFAQFAQDMIELNVLDLSGKLIEAYD
jgi:hypothetical protein